MFQPITTKLIILMSSYAAVLSKVNCDWLICRVHSNSPADRYFYHDVIPEHFPVSSDVTSAAQPVCP